VIEAVCGRAEVPEDRDHIPTLLRREGFGVGQLVGAFFLGVFGGGCAELDGGVDHCACPGFGA
jgi:hypothetical protein